MRLERILKVVPYMWRAKKTWRKPKHASVLIYDRVGSDVLMQYIDPADVKVLDIRGESINLYILLITLLSCRLGLHGYVDQYIKCVNPSAAVTFIDNNPNFYRLKEHNPRLITAFVQNGYRGEYRDVFGHLKENPPPIYGSYKVDYMLAFGREVGNKYTQYIEGQVRSIGSFNNNAQLRSDNLQKGSVLFLSQYLSRPSPSDRPIWTDGGKPVYWDDFFSAERFVLPLLLNYCLEKDLTLKVCGRSANGEGSDEDQELHYYRELFDGEDWQYLPRKDAHSNYRRVDEAEFVVFIDSTLGYESLARGKKTAAFTLRAFAGETHPYPFGWPAALPDAGPFWTNHADETEFERVMDYIFTVSDEEWERIRQRYVPELMEFDPGNTRFLSLMRELGVPLKTA